MVHTINCLTKVYKNTCDSITSVNSTNNRFNQIYTCCSNWFSSSIYFPALIFMVLLIIYKVLRSRPSSSLTYIARSKMLEKIGRIDIGQSFLGPNSWAFCFFNWFNFETFKILRKIPETNEEIIRCNRGFIRKYCLVF